MLANEQQSAVNLGQSLTRIERMRQQEKNGGIGWVDGRIPSFLVYPFSIKT